MRKRYLWWVIVIVWCSLIYSFTASPSYTGNSTQSVIQQITGVSDETAKTINFNIRKATHVTVFGVLAALLTMALLPYRRSAVLAWLLAAAYGAFDEFHQSLVPGRSPSIVDVGINSVGALLGILLICAIMKRRSRNVRS